MLELFDSVPNGANMHCTYQNRVHPHVDSADADQDAPAERHAEAQEERILGGGEHRDVAVHSQCRC